MVALPITVSSHNHPIFCISTAIHSFVTGEPRDFKYCTLIYHSKSHPAMKKGRGQGQVTRFRILHLT